MQNVVLLIVNTVNNHLEVVIFLEIIPARGHLTSDDASPNRHGRGCTTCNQEVKKELRNRLIALVRFVEIIPVSD